ncbi:ACP S-malonyltransferase [Paenibacillus piscarius]|uniref:ACP S-malonyltransferase n=1 Tax=Paenibacillus piscarius TaxID=1089681 RepID=UPI001EE92701|nr:hypothetical protein [Paenibacillus piscarius]
MAKHQFSFIFPGLGTKKMDLFRVSNDSLNKSINCLINASSDIIGFDVAARLNNLSDNMNNELELFDQIANYSLSCAVAKFYEGIGLKAELLCGCSLGIYSALHFAGAYTFKTGIELIQTAYRLLSQSLKGDTGAVAVVIGFTRNRLDKLIHDSSTNCTVEIANVNGRFNHVITGLECDVHTVMADAEREGALKVFKLHSTLPYHHTSFFGRAESEFKNYLASINIRDSKIPLMSCIDQRIISSSSEIQHELVSNLVSNLSWMSTVHQLSLYGITDVADTSIDNQLYKISSSINKSCRFYCWQDLS